MTVARVSVFALALATCTAVGSDRPQELGPTPVARAAAKAARKTSPPSVPAIETRQQYAECLDRIATVRLEPALPGDRGFEARRADILVRAKARPVFFVRTPAETTSARALRIRKGIEAADGPAHELYETYPTLTREPALAREVLLREGYLYADLPSLAGAMATAVKLQHLFHEPRLWIQRGDQTLTVVRRRQNGAYYYAYDDGPDRGKPAQILFLDRVTTSAEGLSTPLHRDVVPLARRLGFDEAVVEHITERTLVTKLRYGSVWVPTLLATHGASVELACEGIPPDQAAEVWRIRTAENRRERMLAAQRAVIEQQIDEDLPFDEPRSEMGQQDGKLRQEWLWAYRYGKTQFEFNEDRYWVFDPSGRPRVPQVCIDFIRDTFERASGSWYRPRGQPRGRDPGRFAFGAHDIDNERSVESFVSFANRHPEWFEVWVLAEADRIPLIRRTDFYRFLFDHRADFRPGDIVTILGPRDDDRLHYHSFFVYESDPLTGVPTLVAANAGRPHIRAWDGEMANAPLRSIQTRIRPRTEWLEAITDVARVEATALAKQTVSDLSPRL